jgi:hypothetical protein
MHKLGIVAEGLPNTDVIIISELIKKILSNVPELCLYPGRDKPNVIKKYRDWLEECRNKNVDKALVIVDQDMSCIKIIVKKMQKRIEGREYRFPVKFHVIERELETWLLSDERAISVVVGKDVPRVNEILEEIMDPKKKLKEILSRAKATYTPEILRRIAEKSDIERISDRCPGFRRFRQSVLDF